MLKQRSTDDDDRYQRPLLVWPVTLCVGGPVINCHGRKVTFAYLMRLRHERLQYVITEQSCTTVERLCTSAEKKTDYWPRCVKNATLPTVSSNAAIFIFFALRANSECVITPSLKVPPHLIRVATLSGIY